MQTYRVVPRSAPRACKAACSSSPSSSSRNMFTTPFFAPAPSHFNPVPEMAPFFRVLDTAVAELANSATGSGGADHRAARHQRRSTFTPRFDVREVGGSYELQGELPGIEQKDLEIEFVDDKTLVIKGRAEREYEGSSNGGLNTKEQEQDKTVAAAAAENNNNNIDTAAGASEHKDDAASEHSAPSYHKASVEDEDGFVDAGAEANNNNNTDNSSQVAKGKAPESDSTVADPDTSVPEQSEPQFKYWVSERSTGSFERRFAFPGRVDQEAVKASLRNGILSVVVPKIVEQGARRIQIQ